jgi:tetratricopeptide (TPR) repeat protein
MHNIAHVCAESLKRNDQAIEILGRAIESNPDDAVALAGRAVMYARAGSRELAMADALQLQRMPIDPVTRYQIGCVYALLLPEAASVDADQLVWEALNHLSLSFVEDLSLVTLADGDPDLGALADNEHFQSMTTLFRQFSRLPSQRSLGAE